MIRKLGLAVVALLLCAVGVFAQQPVTINQASTNATPVNVSCSSAGNCPVNASQVGAPWTIDITKAGSVTLVTVATGGTIPVSGGVVDVTQPSGLTAGTWRGLSLTSAAGLRVATGSDTFHVTVDAAPSTAVTQSTSPWVVSCTAANCTVELADGSANKLTTNSTTYTAKFGLDGNLLGTLGTAFTTPGFVDIKGADGNVFVRQATAANLNATVVGTGTFAVQATQSGNWSVRAQDGAGNALTTNSTTYTAKFALDGNLLGTLGTAFTTAGKVDVKGADGDVFVRQATAANFNATVVGSLSDNGAAATTNRLGTLPGVARSNYPSAKTSGRDSSLSQDLYGVTWIGQLPTGLTTYVASGSGTLSSNATDIAVMPGNATNTVIVTAVTASCTQTTAGINNIMLIKRSAADSGGSSTSMNVTNMDTGDAAGVSAPLFYTANPTLGATAAKSGLVDQDKIGLMAPATTSPNDIYVWPKGPAMGEQVVLRGTAQQLAVNFGGSSPSGAACNVTFKWIETTGL